MTPPFEKFIKNPFHGRIISLDPGETTGYAIWDDSKLTEAGQLATHTVKGSVNKLREWFSTQSFEGTFYNDKDVLVVMEEYRVYSHKTQDHAQSTLHTARLIGAIECLLTLRGIPYVMQGAGLTKAFCTDEKLKDWDFWIRGERHARDAIRHGAYWLVHGKPYDPGAIST